MHPVREKRILRIWAHVLEREDGDGFVGRLSYWVIFYWFQGLLFRLRLKVEDQSQGSKDKGGDGGPKQERKPVAFTLLCFEYWGKRRTLYQPPWCS